MTTYLEYNLDDGSQLLIEISDAPAGLIKAAKNKDGNIIIKAEKRFQEAIRSAKVSAQTSVNELSSLEMDEMELSFGLNAVGSGSFGIGKLEMGVNYQVVLKWKNNRHISGKEANENNTVDLHSQEALQ